MKLKNCVIGTAVQSKTTGLTGVVFDIQCDGLDKFIIVDFNSYEGSLTNKCETVPPESLRKVKSLDGSGGKERVCVIIKNSGVNEEMAKNKLIEMGYSPDRNYYTAEVIYGEIGGDCCISGLEYYYKHCAQHYRDITNEVLK